MKRKVEWCFFVAACEERCHQEEETGYVMLISGCLYQEVKLRLETNKLKPELHRGVYKTEISVFFAVINLRDRITTPGT